MRPQKIIWLCDEAHPERLGQWQTALASLDYIEVTSPTAVKNILAVEDIDCVLVMGDVPGYSATEFLEFVQAISPRVPVIFSDQDITAATVIQLIRAGAFHCFSTRDSMEAVRQAVVQALETRRTQARQARTAANGRPIEIIGESRAIEDVLNTISLVGQRRCTVLITGETGTGKEMVARALHASSPRAAKAMVSVNCSALPENLLEAELFGHVKGAFTGAVAGRIGRFEQAHQSTLFLDEIGELPLELQPKLLRALQEREVQRLGSSDTIKIDVRVVAATNVDLQEKVRQGKFREDLYYRLNVVPLHIPALRDRRSDIPSLVTHFLAKICQLEGIPQKRITPEAARLLCELPWPGNVRQLENIVEAAIALSGGSWIAITLSL